jgi:hypothetical protein
MPQSSNTDPFAAVRDADTAAPNFDLSTDDIIARLTKWQSLCTFDVVAAEADSLEIKFKTLPADMDAFARDLYEFCPDLVDQGTGCIHEMIEAMEEAGEEITPDIEKLIEGVDLTKPDYGVELLGREVKQKMAVTLWWD